MEIIINTLQFFLHLGPHIADLAEQYGTAVYVVLFLIVFCETGVVLMPFLPGDSMLFVVGALAASEKLNVHVLIPTLVIAAILGYWLNYIVGTRLAYKVNSEKGLRFVKREYLKKTEDFYVKYGPKAVVLARFMPFTRTFAPFLAGVGKMKYSHFQFYNVVSAFLWIPTIIYMGYFFGNIPFIKNNFTYVIFAIVIVSLLPIVFEYLKVRKQK
jgi:membrane-associated protein